LCEARHSQLATQTTLDISSAIIPRLITPHSAIANPQFPIPPCSLPQTADYYALMGDSKGRHNAKKRDRRRKKTERLALAASKNKKKSAK
jgi:hypothetical protein